MPSTRDIRRRIRSVKNTAQITRAMQLVAASKMKKAQDQALSGRHYAELMNKVLVNLREFSSVESHPLLQAGEGDRDLFVVITTDKGLCGGLNTNLLKKVVAEAKDTDSFVTVGKKGRGSLGRLQKDLVADFSVSDTVDFAEVKLISKFITEKFTEGEYGSVKVAFTNFINTLSQEPHIETLLPVSQVHLGKKKDYEGMGNEDAANDAPEPSADGGYSFEPDAASVFDTVVPQYVNYEIYQMVLEGRASEHSSRMVAMKSATDNADQIIKDLTLQYNKLRQAAITSELLEITTAQMALQ
ncbi:MAG: ATP synthase F1 subunit gamma [Verrucomicrobiota bacterium]